MKVRKAVITAAGWGTRFLPLTKSQPKEMLPLLMKPLIQYSIEEAVACGAELVVIVTSRYKKSMADHFQHHQELEDLLEKKGDTEMLAEIRRLSHLADICYVHQDEQLGLGHAVGITRDVIGNEPFMLFLPDDIFQYGEQVLRHMLEVYERYRGPVIAVSQVSDEEVSRYGIIDPARRTGFQDQRPCGKTFPCRSAVSPCHHGQIYLVSGNLFSPGRNAARSRRRNTVDGCPANTVRKAGGVRV